MDLLVDESNTLRGVVFQDENMRDYMKCFPEVLFVDATYKLLEIRLPVYLTLCEDSMGNSEVVSVGMLATEDEESLTWMFQTLKDRNPDMYRVRVIVTDKDMKERHALHACFPDARLLLCLFHTLKAFRREVTCEKMGISAGQRTISFELLQRLAYSRSEAAYSTVYEQLSKDAPHTVISYYNDNWHSIRNEWVAAIALQAGNFMNTTNNRIESINAKLKSVIDKFSSLENFLDKLCIILGTMRLERDSKAASQFIKVPTSAASYDQSELQYSQLLTPYASQFVRDHISKSVCVQLREISDGMFAVDHLDLVLEVSASTCTCSFRTSMLLPCAHIFAVRKKLSLDVFDEVLCDRRWHAEYFKVNGRVFASRIHTDANAQEDEGPSTSIIPQSSSSASGRVLSGPQKVKLGLRYGASLANLQADVGTMEFAEHLEVYKELERLWQAGKRAVVVELERNTQYPFATNASEPIAMDADSGLSTDTPVIDEESADADSRMSDPIVCVISDIKMPSRMKRCGRPKGQETTVIGLPKRRGNGRMVPFSKLPSSTREKSKKDEVYVVLKL